VEDAAARDELDRRRAAPAGVQDYLAGAGEQALPADDADLVRRAQAGDARAREELIERYLPLVVSCARSYRTESLEFSDLVQEGCVGLLRALARYEPDRGTPFGTFASWWVRQALQELRSDFLRPFRLPPKALRQLSRLKSEHARTYVAEGREPPLAELAGRVGIDEAQAEALLRADAAIRSIDEPLGGERGELGALGDLLADPLSSEAYEEVVDAIAGEQLRALLTTLSERERDVIASRFGFEGREPQRLTAIGERLGISAERVRQIEERGLAKLRHST
jgi:RNA polymerase sigma factor (sigma-70 family)